MQGFSYRKFKQQPRGYSSASRRQIVSMRGGVFVRENDGNTFKAA